MKILENCLTIVSFILCMLTIYIVIVTMTMNKKTEKHYKAFHSYHDSCMKYQNDPGKYRHYRALMEQESNDFNLGLEQYKKALPFKKIFGW